MATTTAILQVIHVLGSQKALAEAIGAAPALVWQWANGKRPVAAKHCIAIETATSGAVTRHDLRPDVFGPAPQPEQKAA
jgi:DNA-binding transcriptional regulator YdaS (Cro superfamily)